MIWAGLTGGIATGKSTVTGFIRAQGLAVICADELAREVVAQGTSGYYEVVHLFGSDSVSASGELNRKAIAKKVFADKTLLEKIESIIHPRVRILSQQRKQELVNQGCLLAFYDVPLLFEKQMESLFDKTIVVWCERALQKQRLILRDGFSDEEAERRILAQWPLLDKIKKADYVVENNQDLLELKKNVQNLIAQLLSQ